MTANPDSPTAAAARATVTSPALSSTSIFADLDTLKLSLDSAGLAGAAEVLMHVPVRKPSRNEFFRVRPGAENSFTAILYEDQNDKGREYYFVTPAMIPLLRQLTTLAVISLVPFCTKQKVLGIFPLKLPTDSVSNNDWMSTAMAAAELAKTRWVRIQADMSLGANRIFAAESDLGEPVWPDKPFNELLDLAFRSRVIDRDDHPIVNKLSGRV